ncbi:hypothetical protein ACU4GD_08110 [Cupriavidus basilensis]
MQVDYYRDLVAFLEDVSASGVESVVGKRRTPAAAEHAQAHRSAPGPHHGARRTFSSLTLHRRRRGAARAGMVMAASSPARGRGCCCVSRLPGRCPRATAARGARHGPSRASPWAARAPCDTGCTCAVLPRHPHRPNAARGASRRPCPARDPTGNCYERTAAVSH